MKKIVLLALASCSCLYANTTTGDAPRFKSDYRDDQTKVEVVQKLINSSTKDLAKTNPKKYYSNLEQASNFKSGLASYKLANFIFDKLVDKDSNYKFSDLKKYSLLAAEYGYPQAYDFVGQAYAHGLGVSKNIDLGTCYIKATHPASSKDFIEFCQKTYQSFELSPNKGYSFAFEEQQQVNDIYNNFCNSDDDALLNPTFSASITKSLRAKICSSTDKTAQKLKNGDLVLKGKGIKKFKDGTYINYQAPLKKGQIVYQINDPVTKLVFDGNVLKIANKGTKIITSQESVEI